MCSIDGCEKAAKAKSYCGTHYQYLRIYGTPTPAPKQKPPSVPKESTDGYVYVFDRKTYKVYLQHRVVMEAIMGRPLLGTESVHHKNGQRADNRPENLELWSTSQPTGQRVEDKCAWAIELLKLYRPDALDESSR